MSKILQEKKTKITGREAVEISRALARFMKARKSKVSWTSIRLSNELGVSDVRFIQRLLRLGDWPKAAHDFILSQDVIDFPFLRSFLDESWTRADTLVVALKRKLDDEKPRKRNLPAIYNNYEKIRKVHIKTLNYTDNLRVEVKRLKGEVKQLEEQENVDRLHDEIRMLKDIIKGYLSQGSAVNKQAQTEESPDMKYIIDNIRTRYGGVRATLNIKTNIILLECLSEDGFEKIIEKLTN